MRGATEACAAEDCSRMMVINSSITLSKRSITGVTHCLARSLISLVICFTWILGSTAAHAWGAQGHQVIAGLALSQLTPKARAEIDRLLAQEPGETLVSISTWADERKNPITAQWHYVNFPRNSCTFDADRDCPDGQCLVAAIERQSAVLASQASDEKRLTALKYLVHLVADLYQPLHAGYLDDKGGNTYQLQAFMRGSNLHALWDSGIIKNMNEDADAMTSRLLARKAGFANQSFSAVRAAEQSCQIVGMAGFYPARRVGQEYMDRFTPVFEQQLQAAGVGLAGLLNQILK